MSGVSALVAEGAWPAHRPSGWLAEALAAAGASVVRAGRGTPRRVDLGFAPADAPLETSAALGRRARRRVAVLDAPVATMPAWADAVIATSSALRDGLRPEERDGVQVVLPSGSPEFAPAEPGAAELRVACLMAFHWTAGPEYALTALAEARAAGARVSMEIHGSEPPDEATLFAIDDLSLHDAVTLRVRTAGERVAADVLVVSAVQDRSWPEAVAALRAGVPVVGFDLPGLRELVGAGAGAGGTLVPRRDAAALGAALVAIAPGRDGLGRLRERAEYTGRRLADSAATGLALLGGAGMLP